MIKRVFCEYQYTSYGNDIVTYAEFLGVSNDMTAKILLIDGTETDNAGDTICVEFSQLNFNLDEREMMWTLTDFAHDESLSNLVTAMSASLLILSGVGNAAGAALKGVGVLVVGLGALVTGIGALLQARMCFRT